ncbi:uncharacterized protein BO80DRAFT_482527 [Aspergillus ibericus CBS 121593]|uniref:Uncharacterized protein n=1 Tax=Aspergillus ibericus CBS 121593 TaxID=1448316 RepID=A0A395GQN7_9EURO|nr:hypothetical protein BO80DRAFT_482527 [Aspergillus ibericus CBS 121593]RAK97258.1 hypothetical protein BO80DRAFT_482527 [Aspergillus ibericus CBS 121593]
MAEIISLIVATVELSHGILEVIQSISSIRQEIQRSIQEAELVGMFLNQLVDILKDSHPSYVPQMLPCALWIATDCSQTCTKLRDVANAMEARRLMRIIKHRRLHRIQAELEHQRSMLHFTVTMLPLMKGSPGGYSNTRRDSIAELDSANVAILIHQAENMGSRRLEAEAEADDDEPVEDSSSSSSSPSGSILGTTTEVSDSEDGTGLIPFPTDPSRSGALLRIQGQQPMAGPSSAPTRSQWMHALVAFLAAIWRETSAGNLLYGPSFPMDSRLRLRNQTQPQPQPQPPSAGVNPFPEHPSDSHTTDLLTSVRHSVMSFHGAQPGNGAYGSATRRDPADPASRYRPRQPPIMRVPALWQTHASAWTPDYSDSFSVPRPSQPESPLSSGSLAHAHSPIRWETRQKTHNQTVFTSYVDDRMVSRMQYPWDDLVLGKVWTTLRRHSVNRDALQRYGFEFQEAGSYVHVFAKLDWVRPLAVSEPSQ